MLNFTNTYIFIVDLHGVFSVDDEQISHIADNNKDFNNTTTKNVFLLGYSFDDFKLVRIKY